MESFELALASSAFMDHFVPLIAIIFAPGSKPAANAGDAGKIQIRSLFTGSITGRFELS